MKNCKKCNKEFNSKHKTVLFCSHKCANEFTAPFRTNKVEIICKNCHKLFYVTVGELRYRKEIKCCSHKCSGELKTKSKSTEVTCDYCNTKIIKLKIRVKKTNFCNIDCKNKYMKLNPIHKRNGYWYENGYKIVYTNNGNGIKEHIMIMENYIGRKLLPNECVHHKNEIKTDNRIENLELMTRSSHQALHRRNQLGK